MTVPDLDVSRLAKVLINRHGEAAPLIAVRRADELLDVGELEGAAVWRRIVKAIEAVLAL